MEEQSRQRSLGKTHSKRSPGIGEDRERKWKQLSGIYPGSQVQESKFTVDLVEVILLGKYSS